VQTLAELIEHQFNCSIRQWGEPTDDMGGEAWSAVQHGRLICAESLALLISALQDHTPRPVWLLAA